MLDNNTNETFILMKISMSGKKFPGQLES